MSVSFASAAPVAGPLFVERVQSEEGLWALEAPWRELEQSSNNALPFRTFAWNWCWWKHMREDRLAVRDSLAIRTVRRGDGRLVGVAPLMLTERPGVGPFRTRALCFFGADPNMTEIRGALCEPGLEAECHAAIQEDLLRSSDAFDWVEWAGIDERGGARQVLDSPTLQWTDTTVYSVLDLPRTWDELRSSAPRNLKESLRKCYNSLKREGLELSLTAVSRAPRHQDVFEHPKSRAFLVEVCRRFAEQGALRVFRLHVDGALVATRIGFVLGNSLYLYYSGYDPDYAKYSVMTTTVSEAIKYAIDHGLREVNLSTGSDASKQRWRPETVTLHAALQLGKGTLPRAKHHALGWATRSMRRSEVRHLAARLHLSRRAPD
jgi:CelD/BcsL family acetyltransferase involved in cellulose biosynthesis